MILLVSCCAGNYALAEKAEYEGYTKQELDQHKADLVRRGVSAEEIEARITHLKTRKYPVGKVKYTQEELAEWKARWIRRGLALEEAERRVAQMANAYKPQKQPLDKRRKPKAPPEEILVEKTPKDWEYVDGKWQQVEPPADPNATELNP